MRRCNAPGIALEGEDGHQAQLRESFALSNVSEPLLALGKLLRKGWKLEGANDNVKLTHGLFSKQLSFRRNSLVTEAQTRKAHEERPKHEARGAGEENRLIFDGLKGLVEVGPRKTATHRVDFPYKSGCEVVCFF